MTNEELIVAKPAIGAVQRQKQVGLQIHSLAKPCPNCATRNTFFQAAGIEVNDYTSANYTTYLRNLHCVGCKRQLKYCVPIICVDEGGWHWGLEPVAP